MVVRRLVLKNFRNIESEEFLPSQGINFLVGANGQGKTSWLEALSLLSNFRSFRGSENTDFLRWNTQTAEINCTVATGLSLSSWKSDLKITLAKDQNERVSRAAWINEKLFKSGTQYLSQRFGEVELGFHSIAFNPADHDLVRGDPATRRSYLNQVLVAESPEYLALLKRYQRVLEQRNAVLKPDRGPVDKAYLRGFTEQLVPLGAAITWYRLNWFNRVIGPMSEVARKIAPQQPLLTPHYLSSWLGSTDRFHRQFALQDRLGSLEILERLFYERMSSLADQELRLRSSLVGPHRDDWAMFIGEQTLKGHGSQGEVRTSLLALKLSEIDLFRKWTGQKPILLLDDFSSELDRERRMFLLEYLRESDLQVFVTTTEDAGYTGETYRVSSGRLTSVSRGDSGIRINTSDRDAIPNESEQTHYAIQLGQANV